MPGGFGGGRFHFKEKGSKPVISKKILIRIAKYFTPYWKLLSLVVFTNIVTSILGLVPPVLTKNIIDIALPDRRIDLLVILIASSFGALLVNGIILVGQNYLNSWISKNIIKDIREAMFHHLQYMPIRFFSNVKVGEITSKMNNDIGGIENVFSGTVVKILQNIFIFATAISILFYTNWQLAIISMIILPLFIIPLDIADLIDIERHVAQELAPNANVKIFFHAPPAF